MGGRVSILEIINHIHKNDLHQFIIDYADKNTEYRQAFNAKFNSSKIGTGDKKAYADMEAPLLLATLSPAAAVIATGPTMAAAAHLTFNTSGFISHTKALAPSIAASDSFNSLNNNFTLF